MDRETSNVPSWCHQSLLHDHADSTTTTDGELVDERRKSPRARCSSGRLRMEAAVTVHAPWASQDSDGEESDCNDHRAPSVKGRPASPRPPMPGTAVTEGPDPLQRYVRLQEEHVEASVVVLTNGTGTVNTGTTLESLPKGSGKLTFNLTPEQLGIRNVVERVGRTRRSIPAGEYLLSPDASTGEECPRKSSLRRNSAYSNQSEMDKQLALELHPESLPGSDEVCPGPAGTPAGSLRMMLMMIPSDTVRPEDVDGSRGSVSSRVSVSGQLPRRAQHKFDEISTIYDHFPTDFLPDRFLCGLCQKLLREPRVLDCLHTFCRACLERVAATVTHGQDSAQFWQRVNENASFDWDRKS
uniref:Zf-RING_UBOX domain-containing protein n=1 Tax=Anopheles merus TaxID=30066 RepID=A0A182UZL5_ANOME